MSCCVVRKLLKLLLLFSIAAVSLGCGKGVRDTGPFEAYLNDFETHSQNSYNHRLQVNDIKIYFAQLDASILARCTMSDGTPQIAVNEQMWKGLAPDVREVLLFHEFGHCILNRRHDNTKLDSNRRWESLMAQWPQLITDYSQHKEAYLKELFAPANR
jgi:hypothetical protein